MPTFVAAGAQAVGTANPVTPTLPAHSAGDTLVAVCTGRGNRVFGEISFSFPAGWVRRCHVPPETGAAKTLEVWTKKATSGSETNPAISYILAAGGFTAQVATYSGCNDDIPVEMWQWADVGTAALTHTPTAITSLTDNTMVLSVVMTNDDNALGLQAGSEQGFTARMSGVSYDTATGAQSVGLADKTVTTAGSVTMPTWEQTTAGPDFWHVVTLILRDDTETLDVCEVDSVTATEFGTDATAHLVNMPAVVDSGDLLLMLFGADGNATHITPAGWALLGEQAHSTNLRYSAFYKTAAGTEDGTTVDVVTSATEQASAHVLRIPANQWDSATTPLIAEADNNTANADPPNLDLSAWGAEGALRIATYAGDGVTPTTVWPTGYVIRDAVRAVDTNGVMLGLSYRSDMNTAENPAAFTGESPWVAFTIGVRPAQDQPDPDPDPGDGDEENRTGAIRKPPRSR